MLEATVGEVLLLDYGQQLARVVMHITLLLHSMVDGMGLGGQAVKAV